MKQVSFSNINKIYPNKKSHLFFQWFLCDEFSSGWPGSGPISHGFRKNNYFNGFTKVGGVKQVVLVQAF